MGKRLALLIGNSTFPDVALPELHAPWEDVVQLKEVLEELGGFETIPLLNAGLINAQSAVSTLFNDRSTEDFLIFYYTGHGLRDEHGDLYMALHETDTSRLRATSLAASYVQLEMERSASQRQVILLDCCHSGAFSRSGFKGGISSGLVKSDFVEAQGRGRYVLAASASNESAFEDAGKSIFTERIVEGIRTGDAAPGSDYITVNDVHNYLCRKVSEDGFPMRPKLWAGEKTRELIISKNPKSGQTQHSDLVEMIWDKDPNRAYAAARLLVDRLSSGDPEISLKSEKLLRERLKDDFSLPLFVAKPIIEALSLHDHGRKDGIKGGGRSEEMSKTSQKASALRHPRDISPPGCDIAPFSSNSKEEETAPKVFGRNLLGHSLQALSISFQCGARGSYAAAINFDHLRNVLSEIEDKLQEAGVPQDVRRQLANVIYSSALDFRAEIGLQDDMSHNPEFSKESDRVEVSKVCLFEVSDSLSRELKWDRQILEVILACLLLGYKGKFRKSNDPEGALREKAKRISTTLNTQDLDVQVTLPGNEIVLSAGGQRERPYGNFVLAFASVLSALLLGVYLILNWSLRTASDNVVGQLSIIDSGPIVELERRAPPPPPSPSALTTQEQVAKVSDFLKPEIKDNVVGQLSIIDSGPIVELERRAPPPPPSLSAPTTQEQVAKVSDFLKPEIKEGIVEVFQKGNTLTIRLTGSGMFGSGSDQLSERFQEPVNRVAKALNDENGSIIVAGHSDNAPIRSSRFPSNMALSLARAKSVMASMAKVMTEPDRLSAEGRADKEPIADNSTYEGRAKNRRIEVLLVQEAKE